MYDFGFFRANLDSIAERLAARGFTLDPEFRRIDAARRKAITESEQLKAQKNSRSEEIGKLKRAGVDTSESQQQIRTMGDRIAEFGKEVEELEQRFRGMLAGVPNIPHQPTPTA